MRGLPTPDAEGIAQLKEWYASQGLELTETDAEERLAYVMHLLYLLNPNYPGYDPNSHPLDNRTGIFPAPEGGEEE